MQTEPIWSHCYALSLHAVYGWLDGPNFTGDETNEPYPLRIGFLKGRDFGVGPVLSYNVNVTAGTAGKKAGQLKFMCIHKPALLFIHSGGSQCGLHGDQ